MSRHSLRPLAAALLSLGVLLPRPAGAEAITIGVVGVNAFAPVYVAEERGYFAAEGVPARLVYFDSATQVAVAAVAGAVDFGVSAVTAAFYNLAGQGELKIIAAAAREYPGFKLQAFVVSRKALEAGLKSFRDLPGHSFAVTTAGAPPVYVVGGLLAEKYGFDFKSITIVQLQTIPNISTALAGGKADFSAVSLTPGMLPLMDRGDVKLMGWVGDSAPWQFGIAFAATKTADGRRDTVERFLRAYVHGARDYHDALATADEKPKAGPAADEMIKILAKYTKQTVDEVELGIPFIDAEARLDVQDVLHQVRFYKAQGAVKQEVDGADLIDMRYVVKLPER
jgi:NitT/TauT family transport system substrate-binding protein